MELHFKVGEFYRMQLHPDYGSSPVKKVSCLCVRIAKRRIWFEYLYKDTGGVLRKIVHDRRLDPGNGIDCPDEACSRDQFFSMTCVPDDVGTKPAVWNDVPSSYVKKGKWK